MATTTATPTHLLTPSRVDQLVIEHLDPPAWPAYPAKAIARLDAACDERDALSARLRDERLVLVDEHLDLRLHLEPAAVEVHARLDELDGEIARLDGEIQRALTDRREQLLALYRALPHVAATVDRGAGDAYLGAQQWLLHVQDALKAVLRADKRASILAVATALADNARRDGIFLAGVTQVQAEHGIAHSTWTRAATWLAEHGLLRTLLPARQLTQLERALAIGSETHAHVRRWRAVIQLQHAAARIARPAKWVPPARRAVNALIPCKSLGSTGLQPVDNGASRRTAAPSSRPATERKVPRRWRRFDPLTTVLWKRLQTLATGLTAPRGAIHPAARLLGRHMDAQRDRILGSILHASACRVLPHLKRFAAAGAEPAQLVAAIEAAEYRAGRDPARRTWDPNRRLIAALNALSIEDVSETH